MISSRSLSSLRGRVLVFPGVLSRRQFPQMEVRANISAKQWRWSSTRQQSVFWRRDNCSIRNSSWHMKQAPRLSSSGAKFCRRRLRRGTFEVMINFSSEQGQHVKLLSTSDSKRNFARFIPPTHTWICAPLRKQAFHLHFLRVNNFHLCFFPEINWIFRTRALGF